MSDKLKELDHLSNILDGPRMRGKRIVVCHGVFDLLHPGHIRHLKSAKRKGDILNIKSKNDRIHLEFNISARGLIGLTNRILSSTEGEAVISHQFRGFEPWKGDILGKRNGALIAMKKGAAVAYSINKLQGRGNLFIDPNEEVYAGQVIGENTRYEDLVINVIKTKKLSNMRASGSDEAMSIAPATKFSLEEAMEYVGEDEYVEVTPKFIRFRKILLAELSRKRKES